MRVDSTPTLLQQAIEGFRQYGLYYLVMSAMALFGGLVRYLQRLRDGKKHRWLDFATDMAVAGLAGLVTAFACKGLGVPWEICAAMCGVSGQMGARALGIWQERLLQRRGK